MTTDIPGTEPDLTARAAQLAADEKALAAREAVLAERERQSRRNENMAFLEGLIGEGRPLPCPAETVLTLMDSLSDAAPVEFSEGDGKRDPLAVFKEDILAKLPRRVEFAELSGSEGFEAEAGTAQEISRQALAYQEAQSAAGITVSVTEAVHHVTKGDDK